MTDKNQVNAMYVAQNGTMDGLNVNYSSSLGTSGDDSFSVGTNALYTTTGWDFWQNQYYPQVIRESYPIYVRERAEDKGKQAFEVIKMLQDKRFVKFEKVSDFIDAMDALIKIL